MSDWKRRVKHYLGMAVFRSGAHRRLIGDRGVIVLFHRVEDGLDGDPISCDRRTFASFCDFFARYFDVISLSELLDRLEEGREVGGTLVITFDDGYLDNREVAAPILREHGLPACFFVSPGFIGSSEVPWWDAENGIRSRWMSWPDVGALVEMGFEVGAHTMTHVDLGEMHGEQARLEIIGSGEELRSRLGVAVPHFSYPYGRPEQITPANREAVRTAGFRCCLSAFGGEVRGDANPHELRRLPISPWYISPYHLGWEVLFGNR